MIKLISLIIILVTLFVEVSYASAKYEDCEKPPEVENASVLVAYDDSEEFVTATYRCHDGYKLHGKAAITCDLDTDEWHETPPTCVANSHDSDDKSSVDNKKQRRKGKVQEIKEESQITNDFAQNLDLSCMSKGLVKAPAINNGYIAKYNRRRKGTKIFLVAFYECNDDYELENLEQDRLYCSREEWVGDAPKCMQIHDDEGEEETEEDYSDENGNVSGAESEHHNDRKDNNEIPTSSHGDHNKNEESTTLKSTTVVVPRIMPCDEDNGGCDQHCQMMVDELESRIQCSCSHGYTLDEIDGRRCHDINECDTSSHGCEQICNNLPGSYECICHHGLQIDPTNDKKCIDINECLENPSICGENECENSYGTYTCIESPPSTSAATTTTSLQSSSTTALTTELPIIIENEIERSEDDGEGEEEDDDDVSRETDEDEGNKSEKEELEINKISVEEKTAYERESGGVKHEQEKSDEEEDLENSIDDTREEIESDNEIPEVITYAETTSESHLAIPSSTTIENPFTPDKEGNTDEEEENENDGDDEDNVSENSNEDEHHRSDNESEREPVASTIQMHHQSSTVKSDLQNECDDELRYDDTTGKCVEIHMRKHDENIAEKEEEEKKEEDEDEKDYEDNDNDADAEQTTSTRVTHIEITTEGERKFLHEIKPKCQHVDDGVECECPQGYEVSEDESHCQDINECETYENGSEENEDEDSDDYYEDRKSQQQTRVSFCSHTCTNLIGSFLCSCPENFHIHDDMRTCIRDYCADLENDSLNKTKCSHFCVDAHDGYSCRCPNGWTLQNDLKSCKADIITTSSPSPSLIEKEDDYDDDIENEIAPMVECTIQDHETCSPGTCVVISSSDKHYEQNKECQCPSGFTAHNHQCIDVDECSDENLNDCSNSCHNTHGSYYCSCPHGLTMSGNRKDCEDFNECQHDKDICGELECQNTFGGFRCLCADGEEADSEGKCQRKSICLLNNGGCSHSCKIHDENVICDCPDDMDLAEDMKTCVKIDPCHIENGGCSHFCDSALEPNICYCPPNFVLDENDARTCREKMKCKSGFKLLSDDNDHDDDDDDEDEENTMKCVDIDECSENSHICLNGVCTNNEGSYDCHCHAGYYLSQSENNKTCLDIDECENSPCSHRCLNLPGTYQCVCSYGQILMADGHTCGFADLCDLNNGDCAHDCDFVDNKVVCSCRKGYEVDDNDEKNCVDVNECEDSYNGSCQQKCINTEGSFYCACNEGYELAKDERNCVDADECIENNGNCSNICINLIGSKVCACEAGYKLDFDNHTCIDIDECESLHDCSHICINTEGTYECDCPNGFEFAGFDKFNCYDIDECLDSPCMNGRCRNTVGSFVCECEEGYELSNDGVTCVDRNECTDDSHECSHLCINYAGGYNCSCPQGMELIEGDRKCLDINECERDSPCEQICENIEGSFICKCFNGFELSIEDGRSCLDVDECRQGTHECSHICINEEGSYSCACPKNLLLDSDGKRCEHQNLCAFENGGCSQVCEFHHNHTICSCQKGFEIDKDDESQCNDIDECRFEHNCQQQCVNTIGSFRCYCFSGFRMNEQGQCIDINECDAENNANIRCPKTANCINTAGSYKCICPDGYKLSRDRTECIEIKNECKPLIVKNGNARCTRSRHKTQLFYRTKCAISCDKGYKLHGPSIKHCNGTGHWDDGNPICVPLTCPRLSKPEYGTILPSSCMYGDTFSGERCFLHCPSGYKAAGKRVAICNNNLKWQPSAELECIPMRSPTVQLTSSPILQKQHHNQQQQQQNAIRPTIKCHEDMTIVKPKNHETILVHIPKPETNVNWENYVDSQPVWGKKLEAVLPLGATEVVFRARSPHNNMFDMCRMIINVIDPTPPIVTYCPEPFVVHLNPYETSRSIEWREPSFESKQSIKQIFKSKVPGHSFSAGVHVITYLATTQEGLSAKCTFRITVKDHESVMPASQRLSLETNVIPDSSVVDKIPLHKHQHHLHNTMGNHESFLMCPGRRPVKIGSNQPWHLPRGCVIKNVKVHRQQRLHQHRNHHHHHGNNSTRKQHQPQEDSTHEQRHNNNNRLRFYSSWDGSQQKLIQHNQQQQNHQQYQRQMHQHNRNKQQLHLPHSQQFYHAYAPAAHWD